MKIITIKLFVMFFLSIKGNTQVADTSKYLIDSIQNNALRFTGKQLNYLLSSLKINPVSFTGFKPIKRLYPNDTILIRNIDLDFYPINIIIERMDKKKKSANLYIEFAQPIKVPKDWFFDGGKFESTEWDRLKRNFFKKYIVSKVEVRGI